MGRFNKITPSNIKKLVGQYRRTKLLYKAVFWLSLTILPMLFMWAQSSFNESLPLGVMLFSFSLSVHVIISYTAYIAAIIPNILHVMIMPLSFGFYWLFQFSGPESFYDDLLQIYTVGAVFGFIFTALYVWAVITLTRGHMWLTFIIGYVLVDLFGLFLAEPLMNIAALIPFIIGGLVIGLRSKAFHRLVFKGKHTTAVENLFSSNLTEEAEAKTEKLLEEQFKDSLIIPLSSDEFKHMVVTDNRVFLIYSLELERSMSVVGDLKKGIQIKYRGNPTHVEFGYLIREAEKLSKKFSIPSSDITPVILCHEKTLPKDKRFMATKVSKKTASLKNQSSMSGLVYLIHAEKVSQMKDAWRKHALSKSTLKTLKKYRTDDREEEAEETPASL